MLIIKQTKKVGWKRTKKCKDILSKYNVYFKLVLTYLNQHCRVTLFMMLDIYEVILWDMSYCMILYIYGYITGWNSAHVIQWPYLMGKSLWYDIICNTQNTLNKKYLFGLTIFIHFILTKGSIPANSLHFISSGLQVIIITYIPFWNY